MTTRPYIEIARPDHWFKQVFMLPGTFLTFILLSPPFHWSLVVRIFLGFFAACLVASANYVINEVLDAPYDRVHPVKKNRPVPAGRIEIPIAKAEYFLLAFLGLALSLLANLPFFIANASLLLMGVLYNVPPIRTKDVPYLDTLSESVNNPIRLLLGWFIVVNNTIPPLSITLAYWMFGAFLMATKRLAEVRYIADSDLSPRYRKSLSHITQDSLIISMLIYTALFSFMAAVFVIRYHFELILLAPLVSALIGEYARLGFLPNSPAQNPEELYKQKRLMILCISVSVLFFVLLPIRLPWLNLLFDALSIYEH